ADHDQPRTKAPSPNLLTENDGRSEISALVERIANFQRSREETLLSEGEAESDAAKNDGLMPRLPLGEEDTPRSRIVRGFAFAADAAGRIEWAEEGVAPMVVGTRLIAPARLQTGITQNPLTNAFSQRQPIKSKPFELAGARAITGHWVVDAQPRFSQIGGFAGYVGRMRRPIEAAPSSPSPAEREADRIRQLLHELRTPVTAVQGYSEVIQQQLFGSAPHEYRALAAAIASDAARILSGFEELDQLAKFETGAMDVDEGQTDIAGLAQRIIRQLAQVLDARMAGIELAWKNETPLFVTIGEESAESLMWRFLASVGGGCAASETLQARLHDHGDFIHLTCDLPMQLLGEDDLFAADARPSSTAISPGLFGAGFALRLARAEARAGGGDLLRKSDSIALTLPKMNSARETASGNSGADCAAQ
ncbi:MAG: histidine kinase dimerization/phospho-acceptor domain-containing protein, partial [Erythrobacter sp.]|uniref:histidine kinase dimerization/phospho-acceptor domain-containing protein n=1 Tax=Erythrobacter sp. TaxID=1042 RepID=UPI003298A829